MPCSVDNNAFEVIITPSRKRKRDSGRGELPPPCVDPSSTNKPSAFTNAAFSSTPKKEIKSLIQKFNRFPPNKGPSLDKENQIRYPVDSCLEVKSISDLVQQRASVEHENPFEVIRKPPKKKKKTDIEEACFVNPGLNLELPEKQFNPFEVKRDSCRELVKADEAQCFVNPALNIRTQEVTAARNPFEIPRVSQITTTAANGIENPGLDLTNGPLRIGIPFKPTVGCRIDFNNLTPSKMLADKLVFSPMPPRTPRILSDISEEEVTMDIGRELDRYQLELENSINEAKQRKTNVDGRTFSDKLEDIVENSEEEDAEPKTPEVIATKITLEVKTEVLRLEDVNTPPVHKVPDPEKGPSTLAEQVKEDQIRHESFTDDEGIDYDDDEDEDVINFKAPAPFVRAYRKADPVPLHSSKESLEGENQIPPLGAVGSKSKVKNIIRNSIRKFINSDKSSTEEKPEKKPLASSGHHFMDAIRHSLRRRPQKQEMEAPNVREISIIDTSERKMKFKSNLIQTDYIKIEELPMDRKSSLRSSIKKSTRDVKNHIMKSVFHKNNEEYAFAKTK